MSNMRLRDMFKGNYGGGKTLEIDPLTHKMLVATAINYREKYKTFYAKVRKEAVSPALIGRIDNLQKMLDEGSKLIDVISGAQGRMPTPEEMDLAPKLFAEISAAVSDIDKMIVSDKRIREALEQSIEGFSQQAEAVKTATDRFAKRLQERKESVGGFRGVVRDIGKGIAGAESGISTALPSAAGGGLATTGLMAILGPFASLAPLGIAGLTGVRGFMEGMRERRKAAQSNIQRAMLAAALTAEDMGIGGREYSRMADVWESQRTGMPTGASRVSMQQIQRAEQPQNHMQPEPIANWPGRDPKTGRFVKSGTRTFSGSQGKAFAGALVAGLTQFYTKEAFEAKYTKKILELLEGKGSVAHNAPGGMADLVAGGWVATKLMPALARLVPVAATVTAGAAVSAAASYASLNAAQKSGVRWTPMMANWTNPIQAAGSWASAFGEKASATIFRDSGDQKSRIDPTALFRKPVELLTGVGAGLQGAMLQGEIAASKLVDAMKPLLDEVSKKISGAVSSAGTMTVPRDRHIPTESEDGTVDAMNKGGIEESF